MAGAVFVNGRITAETDAVVPVFDHGFLYGEGVYEVCRTYFGRPFLFDRHLRRLRASADRIALTLPFDDEAVADWIDRTLVAADLRPWRPDHDDAYIRLLVTRGIGELTYDPAACRTPTVVIIARPFQGPPAAAYERGVTVALVSIQRNAPAALNPLIKSNNLLNNALAMQEALRFGAIEAVMRNQRGELAEMSQSNLFVVRGGRVSTPPLTAGLLAGITREYALELCRGLDIEAVEATLRDDDLLGADEAFLTSTTREIMPIVRVGEAVVGAGVPGPITRRLMDAFSQGVRAGEPRSVEA
jgi:branched-chain amino acid aminotransferase